MALDMFKSWVLATASNSSMSGALRQLLQPLGSRILLLGAHFICPRVTEYEPRISVGLHHQGEPMNTLLDPIATLDTSGSGFRRADTCSHSKPPLCMPVLECRMSRGHILAFSPHGATGPVIRVWCLVSAVGWSSAPSAACAAPVTTVRLLHAPIQRAPQGPGAV